MSVTKEIERLREYPKGATQEFRDQLQRARESRDKLLGVAPATDTSSGGVDRSRDFAPVARPAIVRTLVDG